MRALCAVIFISLIVACGGSDGTPSSTPSQSPSPGTEVSGRSFAYADPEGAIWLISADDLSKRQLLPAGSVSQEISPPSDAARNAHWSPDGRFIAYVTEAGGLAVVEVDTGLVTTLDEGADADVSWDRLIWTPDGKSILYSKGTGGGGHGQRADFDRWIVSLDGEPRLQVEDERYMELSPDGRRIAFQRWHEGTPALGSSPYGPALFVANVDGGGEKLATDSSFLPDSGTWSPDGRFLAYWQSHVSDTTRDMYVYDVENDRHIPAGSFSHDEQPQWSSTRKEPTFHNLEIDPRLGTALPLFERPGAILSWAPDGEKLAVFDLTAGQVPRELAVLNVATGQRTVIHSSPLLEMAHADVPGYYGNWSPDSRYFAFVSWERDEKNGADLLVADVGTGAVNIAMPAFDWAGVQVAYSRDGERLLIQKTDYASPTIWTANADGSGLTKIADGLAVDAGQWTPPVGTVWRSRDD